jgi:hypothetical protein
LEASVFKTMLLALPQLEGPVIPVSIPGFLGYLLKYNGSWSCSMSLGFFRDIPEFSRHVHDWKCDVVVMYVWSGRYLLLPLSQFSGRGKEFPSYLLPTDWGCFISALGWYH